jgi:ferredoxin--NADP+ reductase
MREEDFDPETSNTCEAVVKESHRITPQSTDEVRHIVLHIDDPAFRYLEGQTIGVLVSGPHAFGNRFHHRRYSIANAGTAGVASEEGVEVSILVRRCFYIDEVSGERYPGVASNYLCDAAPGDRITITGPYRSPFHIPPSPMDNMVMIGTGTGIAPFRAFAQRIYRKHGHWQGQVRLFYGARTGMDLYYMNDVNDDLANYYDQPTFKAFQALTERPLSKAETALEHTLRENAAEAWSLIQAPNTYVYLAGIGKVAEALERTMIQAAGSEEDWHRSKQKLVDENRWSELIYA